MRDGARGWDKPGGSCELGRVWEAHPRTHTRVFHRPQKLTSSDYSAFIFIWYGYAAGAGPSTPRIGRSSPLIIRRGTGRATRVLARLR